MLALLPLAACARLEPPLTDDSAQPAVTPAPDWLPDEWIASPLPPTIPLEAEVIESYHPADRAAPLLELARYDAEAARRLGLAVGRPGFEWLVDRVDHALRLRGVKVTGPRDWLRRDLSRGSRWEVRGLLPEGYLGELAGEVAVGEADDGSLLVVSALDAAGSEPTPAGDLLAAVPATP